MCGVSVHVCVHVSGLCSLSRKHLKIKFVLKNPMVNFVYIQRGAI